MGISQLIQEAFLKCMLFPTFHPNLVRIFKTPKDMNYVKIQSRFFLERELPAELRPPSLTSPLVGRGEGGFCLEQGPGRMGQTAGVTVCGDSRGVDLS